MRERSDPLVPILGSAVAVVVIGAIAVIFYPRVSAWLEVHRPSVVGTPPAPDEQVPVWLGESEAGVAFVLTSDCDDATARILDEALDGGPYHYLRLTVYNFEGPDDYVVDVAGQRFASPEGGPPARAAAEVMRADAPAPLRAVLRGLGAATRLDVPKGHSGTLLLVMKDDPSRRTAFLRDGLRLERRQLRNATLASWRQHPELDTFKEFQ